MRLRLGKDCKLYRNTASYDTPTWNEMPKVRDLTLDLGMGEAEVSNREVDVEMTEPTLKKVGLEFETTKDLDDTDYRTLRAAWVNRQALDLAISSGPIADAAMEYARGVFKVFSMKNAQPLQGAEMVSWSLKPCYSAVGFSLVTVAGTTTTTTTTQEA